MQIAIRPGQRLPAVHLAELEFGEIRIRPLEKLLSGRKVLVVGVPGAFTPVCTTRHLPAFVEKAGQLKASGFDEIFCIAPNDPWTLEVWARQIDPEGRLRFLSDGNLEFIRAAGLVTRETGLFLGDRSRRYTLSVTNAVVDKLNVETDVIDVTCSRAEVLLAA